MQKRKRWEWRGQYLAGAGPGQAEGGMAHELRGGHSSFPLGSRREAVFGQENGCEERELCEDLEPL